MQNLIHRAVEVFQNWVRGDDEQRERVYREFVQSYAINRV